MIKRELLGTAQVPGGGELKLYSHDRDFMIVLGGNELMSSRMSGSEVSLATETLARLGGKKDAKLLIGGYGMGFTLRAALAKLGKDARITVAELVPELSPGDRVDSSSSPLPDLATALRHETTIDHEGRTLSVSAAPLADQAGIVWTLHDMTERARLERAGERRQLALLVAAVAVRVDPESPQAIAAGIREALARHDAALYRAPEANQPAARADLLDVFSVGEHYRDGHNDSATPVLLAAMATAGWPARQSSISPGPIR